MRLRTLALAAFVLLSPSHGVAQSFDFRQSEGDNRREFRLGVAAMFAGHYDEAIATFRELSKQTDAPRVKLELGRSLFLAKRYKEAKRVFNDVYYSAGLPYEVRRSINVYLEKIDRKIGFLVPDFGLSIDTNPIKATSATDFLLLGLPVVLSQQKHSRAMGVQYGLAGRKPIDALSTFSIFGSIAGIKYSQSPNSFENASAGLAFDDKSGKLSLESGVQYLRRENSDTLMSPYVAGTYRLNSTNPSSTDLTAVASYNIFKYNFYLNGPAVQASVRHAVTLGKTTTLIAVAHASIIRASDPRYNQVEGGISASLYHSLKIVAADLVLSGNIGKRNFAQIDPLFGAIRRDTDVGFEIQVLRTKPIKRLGNYPLDPR